MSSPGDSALKAARQRHGWSMSKGSRRRSAQIDNIESDLRWALLYEKDPQKKQEILKDLEKHLEKKHENS